MTQPATFVWLRPPRPERVPAADRIRREASRARGAPPPHAKELRHELLQLSSSLDGELVEEDAARTAAWLNGRWPWEIAGSFASGGYRWLVTGRQGSAHVFVLLCEPAGVSAGSLDVVVVDAGGILPTWPRPPRLPRSYVTVSTRAMPHGLHFWCHLDAVDLEPDLVMCLVGLGAGAVADAIGGGGRDQLGGVPLTRAGICARCSAVSAVHDCVLCHADMCFRIVWGAVRRPRWHQTLVVGLWIAIPLVAAASIKAHARITQQPVSRSMLLALIALIAVVSIVLGGLSWYMRCVKPRARGDF